MIRYWQFLCLFLPLFLFWCLCQNYFKSLAIEEKRGIVWGGMYQSEAEKIHFWNWDSICTIWCKTFWQHFTQYPIFFYDKILAIIRSIPPTFFLFWRCWQSYKHLWPLSRNGRVSEGECLLHKLKNAILKLNLRNLVHTFCQHFTKIYYKSFPIKYWLLSGLFLPPFLVLMPLPEL